MVTALVVGVVLKGVSHQVWPSAKIGKCIATLWKTGGLSSWLRVVQEHVLESHENFHSFWLNWARTPFPSLVGKAVIPCVWPLVGRLSTEKYGFIYKARIVKENGRSFNSTIFVWALIFITHTRFCSEAGITFKNVMILWVNLSAKNWTSRTIVQCLSKRLFLPFINQNRVSSR